MEYTRVAFVRLAFVQVATVLKALRPLAVAALLCLAAPSAGLAQSGIADDTVRAFGELLKSGIQPGGEDAGAEPGAEQGEAADTQTPEASIPSSDPAANPVPGRLYARLIEDAGALSSGVRWRVYKAEPEGDGSYQTIAASDEPQPVIEVKPGEYIAVAVFGHAVGSSKFSVSGEPFREAVTLNAGALRLTALKADGSVLSPKAVKLAVYSAEQDEFGQRKLIVDNAKPGRVIVLNAGSYHVRSQYGDANSSVEDDVKVEPAQLTDARISHKAAR